MVLEIDAIEFGQSDELQEKINEAKRELATLSKPNVWDVFKAGNQETKFEIDLAKMNLQIGKHFNTSIENMTVKQYYIYLDILDENKNKK